MRLETRVEQHAAAAASFFGIILGSIEILLTKIGKFAGFPSNAI